ncbi:MAG: hypothetical protein J3R72DRAFT_180209 [Linnemannia gamsii]|nr:MAG: hypothetical protein J3R72DRAFT_180209 [Linnemannia gamsii]
MVVVFYFFVCVFLLLLLLFGLWRNAKWLHKSKQRRRNVNKTFSLSLFFSLSSSLPPSPLLRILPWIRMPLLHLSSASVCLLPLLPLHPSLVHHSGLIYGLFIVYEFASGFLTSRRGQESEHTEREKEEP